MARIVCVGEAMLELSRPKDGKAAGDWRLGYGGDTINTAIHLARAGHDTAYLTALGGDPFSDGIKERWRAEGLDVSLVLTHPDRNIGLYAIDTDDSGERSFTYWREASAARAMFALDGIDAALAEVDRADLLYFSLITLAVLPPGGRDRLLALARRARRVAFDGNYRPRLWPSVEEARAARDAAIAVADIGLPTLDDEAQLMSGHITDGREEEDLVAAHWQELGCSETVVKLGPQGARLPDGRIIAPERALDPVDTSGAGDAFNAGYLAARLYGASIEAAARAGHALAGWTIMRPGAIPARDS
jgi:2-dehydro-3-deoxygluconokinase